ncbi:DNA polymerase I [Rhodomicrobium vannielii]|uniref:DNA polymerase I n=1 Tax=Rhodomicrobium vannielii TaxID=1069 RepID=UPI003CCF4E8D
MTAAPSLAESPVSAPAEAAVPPGSRVYLIDGSGYIFRAFHALPPLTRPSDGLPVGAVHGFCNMLWKLLRETKGDNAPTHLAVIFDHSRANFRTEISATYKAQRPEPPAELVPQFALIRDAVRAFNVACIEQEGFEADDIIAAYTCQAADAGADVVIVSSDKDLMQLVRPGVTMLDTMKNKVIGEAEVIEKFGVPPEKVVDVQALAGDSVDNVPGVPGIGIKTAAELIREYGDLENLLANAALIKQKMRRERLIEFADQARLSRRLVELNCDMPVEKPLDLTAVEEPDPHALLEFLRTMEFNSLTKRISEAFGVEPSTGEMTRPSPVDGVEAGAPEKSPGGDTPADEVRRVEAWLKAIPFDRSLYVQVTDLQALEDWIAAATEQGFVAFDTETTALDAMSAKLCGVALALEPGRACYIPLAHRAGDGLDFTGAGEIAQLPMESALPRLKALLEDDSVLKIGQNIKYDALIMRRHGDIRVAPYDDTMLMAYACDQGRGGLAGFGMDELSKRHLGHTPIAFTDVAGKGKAQSTFDCIAVDKATEYAAEDADVTLRLWHLFRARIAAEGMAAVYATLERPMPAVLGEMEFNGIKVDRAVLSRLSADFAQSLARLEDEIYELAGQRFNIGSPQQIADLLFGKFGLPGAKKTSTGKWSTGAKVLEDLVSSEDLTEDQRRLPAKLLEWRQLAKLKSTYTDSLPQHIDADTGRIHTCYSLASTSTGRLSSTEPNLQNIPIRTREGRMIRSAFIAAAGKKLISADYSQIELRVLAHMADIPALKHAFAEGLDIHAMTASEMFGVPVKDMPGEVRRRAKAINFGIIYGISAFGLSQQLGIPRQEAGDYIAKYFERFPGIRAYMDAMRSKVHEDGHVETLFGRKIHFPEIKTPKWNMRQFFERAAINAPIQGTAADIIRRAMVRVPAALEQAGVRARMLLQVHDELVFEADDAEVEATIKAVTRVMERAAEPAVAFSVPLKVDARAAQNWDEAH